MTVGDHREGGSVEVEPVLAHPEEDFAHRFVVAEIEIPDRGGVVVGEWDLHVGGQPVDQVDSASELLLALHQLGREVDVRRHHRRPQCGRGNRSPEGEGRSHQLDEVGGHRVGHRHDATGGPERLRQSPRDHQTVVPGGSGQECAPPMETVPAQAMRVVAVHVETRMPLQ